jgi:hypothetical protein
LQSAAGLPDQVSLGNGINGKNEQAGKKQVCKFISQDV